MALGVSNISRLSISQEMSNLRAQSYGYNMISSGDYFSTPSSAANQITGNITLIVETALDDWTPSVVNVLLAKDDVASQRSYQFNVQPDGKIRLNFSTNGTTITSVTSTIATGFADGTKHHVAVERDSSTGNVRFYTSEDHITWTQLGSTVNAASGAIFSGTAVVQFGNLSALSYDLRGKIYDSEIYSGFAISNSASSTLKVNFNPADKNSSYQSWISSETKEVWTANGNALVFGANGSYNQMIIWAKDYASVKTNTKNSRILLLGDSTDQGSITNGTNQRPNESKHLANLFLANGIKANDDANFGMSDFTTSKRLFKDLRYSGTFSMYSAVTLGGYMAQGTAVGQTLTYTPETTCDRFRVFFLGTGSSTATVLATGGTATPATSMATIGQAFGTTALRYIDVSAGSLAAGNSVTITMASGTLVAVAAIECWDSTASQIICVNAGWFGSSTPNWIVSNSNRGYLDILNGMPDGYYSAVFMKFGINDAGNNNSITSIYKPNFRTILNAIGTKASRIIEAANPISSGAVDAYNVANAEIATEYNIPFVNNRLDPNFTTYAVALAASKMADSLHPNSAGLLIPATYDYNLLSSY